MYTYMYISGESYPISWYLNRSLQPSRTIYQFTMVIQYSHTSVVASQWYHVAEAPPLAFASSDGITFVII